MRAAPSPARLPGLDILRLLGALWLFHLVFFAGWAAPDPTLMQGSGTAARLAARAAGVLATSGVAGLELLLTVSGFLAFRDVRAGRAGSFAARFLRLAAPLAVLAVAYAAYSGGPFGAALGQALLLRSPYSTPLLEQAVGGVNPFLAFLPLAWAWAIACGRFPRAAGWPALAALWAACAGLALAGPAGLTPNVHLTAFCWGALAARISQDTAWTARVPAWAGPFCFLAAVALCHKLSALKGADPAYLIAGRDLPALAQATALQALCALAVLCSLKPGTAPAWLRPLTLAGSATYGFFIAWTHWSGPLAAGIIGPDAPLPPRYLAVLGVSLFVALALRPCLDRLPRRPIP
ncbi:hypothetical protein [Fundidesulfovibrio magnetotacticus]|nr:hypothetical protein [Fundidesulfovibrio magnetotacticus]